MDLLNNLRSSEPYLWPLLSFLVGVSGCVHCFTMCSGIVLSSTKTNAQKFSYQAGRLISYLIVGSLLSLIGKTFIEKYFNELFESVMILLVLSVIIAGIYFLVPQSFKVKLTSKISSKLFGKVFAIKSKFKSFFIGLITIFLPCGFLYSFLFIVVLSPSFLNTFISVIFFWAGTLPALIGGPIIIEKLIKPLKKKSPKFVTLFIILLGIFSVTNRSMKYEFLNQEDETKACH